MKRFIVAPAAKQDLKDIRDHIAKDSASASRRVTASYEPSFGPLPLPLPTYIVSGARHSPAQPGEGSQDKSGTGAEAGDFDTLVGLGRSPV